MENVALAYEQNAPHLPIKKSKIYNMSGINNKLIEISKKLKELNNECNEIVKVCKEINKIIGTKPDEPAT